MPLPLVLEYLETHSFKQLFEEHGVKSRPSADGSKYSLNYDQITSKPGDKLSEECRGMVIHPNVRVENSEQIVGESTLLCRPMDRFYNADDSHAAKIDWSTARIQEKLDGTMIALYSDPFKHEWCIATRSVCEADVPFNDVHPTIRTFADLFKHAVEQSTYPDSYAQWAKSLNPGFTYVYELTGPLNRVVVKYDDHGVTKIADRETQSGKEDICNDCKTWDLSNLEALTAFVNNSDPKKLEGAVVVDAQFNRVKVKSKQWVLASRAKETLSMSQRNALDCIIRGQLDAILPLLDEELAQTLMETNVKILAWAGDTDDRFAVLLKGSIRMCSREDAKAWRKGFARLVAEAGEWDPPMFALLNPEKFGATTLDWLRQLAEKDRLLPTTLDKLAELLKLKEPKHVQPE